MTGQPTKPTWLSDLDLEAALLYLDELREEGTTNMHGARSYVQRWWRDEYGFDLTEKQAREILFYWMETFSERHKKVTQ